MTSTSRVIPYPFVEVPVGRMFEVMIGTLKLELKPEWQGIFSPSDRAVEPRKDA